MVGLLCKNHKKDLDVQMAYMCASVIGFTVKKVYRMSIFI